LYFVLAAPARKDRSEEVGIFFLYFVLATAARKGRSEEEGKHFVFCFSCWSSEWSSGGSVKVFEFYFSCCSSEGPSGRGREEEVCKFLNVVLDAADWSAWKSISSILFFYIFFYLLQLGGIERYVVIGLG